MSSVGSRWRSRAVLALSLPVGDLGGGAEVGWGGGHQEDVGVRELAAGRVGELLGGLDVYAVDAGGLGEGYVGGDQGYVGPAAGRGCGQGDAHAAAGAVADEADRSRSALGCRRP